MDTIIILFIAAAAIRLASLAKSVANEKKLRRANAVESRAGGHSPDLPGLVYFDDWIADLFYSADHTDCAGGKSNEDAFQ